MEFSQNLQADSSDFWTFWSFLFIFIILLWNPQDYFSKIYFQKIIFYTIIIMVYIRFSQPKLLRDPFFYHNLSRRRKAILYGSLLGQFYLPPSNKKGLKVFKNVYISVDIILFTKYPIDWPLRLILYFGEKVPRPTKNLPRPVGWETLVYIAWNCGNHVKRRKYKVSCFWIKETLNNFGERIQMEMFIQFSSLSLLFAYGSPILSTACSLSMILIYFLIILYVLCCNYVYWLIDS
jgi:hypothetical protein